MSRILLLSDGGDSLKQLRNLLLLEAEVELTEAVDSRGALAAIESGSCDLLITYLGREGEWRSLISVAAARVPVLVCSDRQEPELAAGAIRHGATLYLDTRRQSGQSIVARVTSLLAEEGGGTAVQPRERIARLEAEARQFRLIFDHMLSGFAYHRIILDDSGEPTDFTFLQANPAFEAMTGLHRETVLGRPISETQPGFVENDAQWIRIYGEVALTGKSIHFERYSSNLQRWLEVSAYSPERYHFATVFDDVTERKEAEQELRSSLLRKTTLLREIHHRVKNNMQIVSSLLSLQLNREGASPAEALQRSQERIQSMAMIHEFLYRSADLKRVELCEYVQELGQEFLGSNQPETRFTVRGETVYIPGETAFSVGLVISEALSNALVHGLEEGAGEITITVESRRKTVRVTVEDDGPGFDPDADVTGNSLGYTLMREMAAQIGGSLSVEQGGGARIVLEFAVEQEHADGAV